MHLEYSINKPLDLSVQELYRMVAGLTEGEPAVFSDGGDTLLLRTKRRLKANSRALRTLENGYISAFELRASVPKKSRGQNAYYPVKNWRARHRWISQEAMKNGFEILAVHSWSKIVTIENGSQRFELDQTDFSGILRVLDKGLFANGLINGIGSTAKSYGFGMLIID
jgi:hypothetical protein